ncbi:MAG: hypothetical protein GC192_02045 [Bacteroidetes bacterium]|nr:hypothetical protein [Bacteroidota bacterium]
MKPAALLISYSFPPYKSNSLRSFYINKELKKYFDKISIITTSNRKIKSTHIDDSHINSAKTLDYRTVRAIFAKNKYYKTEETKSKLNFRFYNLLNSFPLNLLFGEGGLIYIIHGAFIGLRVLKSTHEALLFSTFRPYSDHAIAYIVKLILPQKLYWVADFRDLHLDPALNETYFPKFQRWCNRKILAKADIVTTVSKGLAVHLKPFHNNVVVLRNGIGLPDNRFGAVKHMQSAEFFTITYTGSMFRDLRKPDLLLEALSELFAAGEINREKVKIKYAGKDSSTWIPLIDKYGIPDIFESLGSITHPEAVQLQSASHINLLLTYSTPELKGNATGKLYEYLSARQPILLLVNGCQDDELSEIFEETNAGLIAYCNLNQKQKVKDFILEKYQEWEKTGNVVPVIPLEALEKYRWENMLKDFLDNHVFNNKKIDSNH